jgi:hypothetical protein
MTELHGARNGRAKLTSESVTKIRLLNGAGVGYKRLAQMFGVSRRTVQRIVRGERWSHLG